MKIEHEPNKSDDDRSSYYKFGQGNPFHDYWWRFEAEPFKFGRAMSSPFGRMSHKKGLLIMSLKYSALEGHMGVTLVSAVHVQRLACEVFDAPERLPSMNIQNVIRGLRVSAGLSALVLLLCGCAVGVAADIVSVGTTGKSITDHVLDVVTGKDCNLFQAAWRSDRDICEPRETEVTTRDIKELPDPGNSPEGQSADPSLATVPSVGPGDPFGSGLSGDPSLAAVPNVDPGDSFDSGPSGDPGGPSGGELY